MSHDHHEHMNHDDHMGHDHASMGHNMAMDHSEHMGHGGGDDMCPMQMIFHLGNCEAILFSSWTVKEVGSFVGVSILIFLVAVLYEGLKYFREKLYFDAQKSEMLAQDKDEGSTQNLRSPAKPIREQILNKQHFIQTLLHMLQVTVSYLLMLIVMTYNVWLFIAVVLGAATGYFFFGWVRNRAVDVTEHCH